MKGVHDVYNEEWDSEGSGEEEEEEGEGERAIEGKFRWEVRYTYTPVTFAKIFLQQI